MITEYSNQQQQQSAAPESMILDSSSHSANQQPQPQVSCTSSDDNSLIAMSAAITAAIEMANSGRPASSLNSGSASILRPATSATAAATAAADISATDTATSNSTAAMAQRNRSRSASVRSIFSSASRKTSIVNPSTSLEPIGSGMVARPKRSSSLSTQQSPVPSSRHSRHLSLSNRNYSARFSWFIGAGIEETEQDQATTEAAKEAPGVEEIRPSQDNMDNGHRELLYRGIRVKEIKTTLKTMVIPHDVENPMPQIKLERPGFARINY